MATVVLYLELLVKIETSHLPVKAEDYHLIDGAEFDWVEYEKKFFQFKILLGNAAIEQVKEVIETILKREYDVMKATWLQPKKEVAELAPVPFEVFWERYAYKKGAKSKAFKAWEALEAKTQHYIIDNIETYKQVVISQPYPATFLNQRHWESEDWLKPSKPLLKGTEQEEKPVYQRTW